MKRPQFRVGDEVTIPDGMGVNITLTVVKIHEGVEYEFGGGFFLSEGCLNKILTKM